MAFTQDAQMGIRVVDAAGVKSSVALYAQADPTKTLAQVVTDVQTTVTDLDAITDGLITESRFEMIIALPDGIKGAPAAGCNVEKTGLFTFSNTANPRAYGEDVPAIAAAVLAGDRIDSTNASVEAWVALLTSAATTVRFTNQQFLDLAAILSYAVTFRKHRRSQSRVSYEA